MRIPRSTLQRSATRVIIHPCPTLTVVLAPSSLAEVRSFLRDGRVDRRRCNVVALLLAAPDAAHSAALEAGWLAHVGLAEVGNLIIRWVANTVIESVGCHRTHAAVMLGRKLTTDR